MLQATDDGPITLGALRVRFLVEASNSNGTASVFECHVPTGARMPAPHSHDGFEETIYGSRASRPGLSTARRSRSRRARRSACGAGRPTGLRTTARPTRPSWRSRPRACSDAPTSNSSPRSSRPAPAARRPRRDRRRDAPSRPHPLSKPKQLTPEGAKMSITMTQHAPGMPVEAYDQTMAHVADRCAGPRDSYPTPHTGPRTA